MGAFGITLLVATIIAPPRPRLLWNASESAPVGLYEVDPYAPVVKGDLVAALMPARHRPLAAARGYVPVSVPLLKRIGAVAGDQVCARGRLILINSHIVAERQTHDTLGRPLPSWQACRRLARDELFLLIADERRSFDGRYFGISRRAELIGRAVPLWTG